MLTSINYAHFAPKNLAALQQSLQREKLARYFARTIAYSLLPQIILLGAQWLLEALVRGSASRAARVEAVGMRIGGALLAGMAIAALLALALGQPHPFCAA